MAANGARVGAGRPADPNALRPVKRDAPLALPAESLGPVPKWPFPTGSTRERSIWAKLWRGPHGSYWRLRKTPPEQVANYVRFSVVAESGDTKASVEARQWDALLGISPAAMNAHRITVAADEVQAKRPVKKASSSRSRLKIVNE